MLYLYITYVAGQTGPRYSLKPVFFNHTDFLFTKRTLVNFAREPAEVCVLSIVASDWLKDGSQPVMPLAIG